MEEGKNRGKLTRSDARVAGAIQAFRLRDDGGANEETGSVLQLDSERRRPDLERGEHSCKHLDLSEFRLVKAPLSS